MPTPLSLQPARFHLHHNDCMEALRALAARSIDSLVTDPPAGIAFMGKNWDKDKGGRAKWVAWMTEVMAECFRVLKPGAHALVWAIPRTSHWTATALEDAGFEIRDVVTHLFGTGFPKSLDVSKAIDKAAGKERPRISGGQGGKNAVLGARKPGEAISGEAIEWQGWGTALKPASEHWILARKPLGEKTVAANVLKHGTGAVNVDGCRIETVDNLNGGAYSEGDRKNPFFKSLGPGAGEYRQPTGRFPANLLLSHHPDCEDTCTDGCAVKALDGQSGILKSGNLSAGHRQGKSAMNGGGVAIQRDYGGDSGGASRFFYCAKASKRDRGEGNTHPTVKSTQLMRYLCRLITPPGGTILDPFAGSGSTGVAALAEGFRFVGIEQDAEYVATAERRLEEVPAG